MKINSQEFNKSIYIPTPISYVKKGDVNQYFYPIVSYQGGSTQSGVAPGLDTLKTYPFIIAASINVLEVITRVNGGTAAGRTYRLGVYDDNGNCYPNKLIPFSDTGTYSASSTGVKTGVFANTITLTPGLYWMTTNASNATPSLRHISLNLSIPPVLGMKADGTAFNTGWSVAFTYAAMPQYFPTGATLHQNANLIYGFKTSL